MAAVLSPCWRCNDPQRDHADDPCPAPEPFWNCPDHGTELLWTGSDEWQDHYECPAKDCKHGRWI